VIREGLVANRFNLVYGILNGTCNYILTRMERANLTFTDTLADARKLGYVEADESLDLDGWDTAHKAVILAFLTHGMWVELKDLLVEGIREITLQDIKWAKRLGYKIKLLGIVSKDKISDRISVRVYPALISKHRVLANVDEVYNGVSVNGDVVGTTVHIGRGAGQDATASAVISDIADAILVRSGATRAIQGQPYFVEEGDGHLDDKLQLANLSEISGKYYLRLQVIDRPGVLEEVAHEMAKHDVSIASLNQPKVSGEKSAKLILTTHESNESSIQNALGDLNRLESVLALPFLLRIVDFEE
jgi:homoserine dehydrogenase